MPSANDELEANPTLAAIVTASPAAIVVLDLDGTVRMWNPAAERIFGWSAAEVIGRRTPVVDDAHTEELSEGLREIAAGQSILGIEVRRQTRDRGPIDVALWAAPIVGPGGMRQCLSIVVDITDRKRAERPYSRPTGTRTRSWRCWATSCATRWRQS